MEDRPGQLRPFVPGDRPHDGFHVGDAHNRVGMPVGPVEPEGRSPVVDHEHHSPGFGQTQMIEQTVEVVAVLFEGVAVGARLVERVGVAHADEIGSNTPSHAGQMGNDVAPQVGTGWVAVKEDNGNALSFVDIQHRLPVDNSGLFGERKVGA